VLGFVTGDGVFDDAHRDVGSFRGLAAVINPIVSGWINYYGRFYKSKLMHFLEQQINPFLVKWAMRKYKRLRRAKGKTRRKLAEIASAFPGMFAHWNMAQCLLVRRWEPGDGRLSRRVLRVAAGEIPAATHLEANASVSDRRDDPVR
jgi:hypothetical protein